MRVKSALLLAVLLLFGANVPPAYAFYLHVWSHPGSNPFRGTLEDAVDLLAEAGVPAEVLAEEHDLYAYHPESCFRRQFVPGEVIDYMTFGRGEVLHSMVVPDTGMPEGASPWLTECPVIHKHMRYALIVPDECGNYSQIIRPGGLGPLIAPSGGAISFAPLYPTLLGPGVGSSFSGSNSPIGGGGLVFSPGGGFTPLPGVETVTSTPVVPLVGVTVSPLETMVPPLETVVPPVEVSTLPPGSGETPPSPPGETPSSPPTPPTPPGSPPVPVPEPSSLVLLIASFIALSALPRRIRRRR